MDGNDIDEWFEEEKRKLEQELARKLEEGRDHEQAKKAYSKKLKALLLLYEKKYDRVLGRKQEGSVKRFVKEKVSRPLARGLDELAEAFKEE